ncbi:hypothetical protein DMN91_010338 [Ooceraea biroi]|uniref:Uncharacterized protein n=1 Tax=Ooceraea biroi TaxID=2015173 RepID=A0A3L8DCA0_OOCBI|nr:hypothetical protein DMN91_010338 [Ooceraea biroi]
MAETEDPADLSSFDQPASTDQHPQSSQASIVANDITSDINADFVRNKVTLFKTELVDNHAVETSGQNKTLFKTELVDNHAVEASGQDKNDAKDREQVQPHNTSIPHEERKKNQENSSEFHTLESLFEKILNKEICVTLPSQKWGIHIIEKPSQIIFSELASVTSGEKITHSLWKKVVLSKDGLQLYIHQKHLELEIIHTPKTKEELEHLLVTVDELFVCEGGPKTALYKNIHLQRADKDENNRWRHASCPIVINSGRICRFCVTLEKTIAQYIDRQRKNNFKQKRFIFPPSMQTKVKPLIHKIQVERQKCAQTQERIIKLKQQVKRLRKLSDIKVIWKTMLQKTKCPDCRRAFTVNRTNATSIRPKAQIINSKTRGKWCIQI